MIVRQEAPKTRDQQDNGEGESEQVQDAPELKTAARSQCGERQAPAGAQARPRDTVYTLQPSPHPAGQEPGDHDCRVSLAGERAIDAERL